MPILALSAMLPGQEADMFLVMTLKEQLTTREGKPYYRVGFRDGGREVAFPIWDNSPWAAECRDTWTPGRFYKVRAVYRETNYGPQLDIRKIREVCDADAADGFDPTVCLPHSRYEPQRMFEELLVIVRERIIDTALRALVEKILIDNRGVAADPGSPAQSSCLRGRLARAHVERDADGDLPGPQLSWVFFYVTIWYPDHAVIIRSDCTCVNPLRQRLAVKFDLSLEGDYITIIDFIDVNSGAASLAAVPKKMA